MTEEEHKGVDWVLEQLEKISVAMIPSETCINCKECPKKEFENCMKGMGIAISDLAIVMVRVVEHINLLYSAIRSSPEIKKELEKNGFEYFS